MMIQLMQLNPLMVINKHILLLRSRKHRHVVQKLNIPYPLPQVRLKHELLLLPVKHTHMPPLPRKQHMNPVPSVVQSVRPFWQLQVENILLYSLLEQRLEVVLSQFEQFLILLRLEIAEGVLVEDVPFFESSLDLSIHHLELAYLGLLLFVLAH